MQIRIINIPLIDSGDEQAEFFSPQRAQRFFAKGASKAA
jgi:hypothetical protein